MRSKVLLSAAVAALLTVSPTAHPPGVRGDPGQGPRGVGKGHKQKARKIKLKGGPKRKAKRRSPRPPKS